MDNRDSRKIIDIHAHIHMRAGSLREQEQALLEDMERFGIVRRVVSAVDGGNTGRQNTYMADLIGRFPEQLTGCAVINPKEEGALEEADRIQDIPGVRAVEFNSLEDGYYPDSYPNIDTILAILERKKPLIKVFAGIGSRAMPQQWRGHFRRHPDLEFVILHMACFDYGYGCIDLAKEYPNVRLETSNQYEVQILKKALDQLPPEKLVFGSSFPERLTKCSLDIFDMFETGEEFRDKVYHKNAAGLLRLPGEEG